MFSNAHMRKPTDKILDTASLKAWRETLPAGPGALAVVVGNFDVIHPGGVFALRRAVAECGTVCAVLPSDHPSPGVTGSRPWDPLDERMESVSHMRSVAAVCALGDKTAEGGFEALKPYTLVTCPQAANESIAAAASAGAEKKIDLPFLRGFTTNEIVAAIRKGRTPLRIPADYPKLTPPGTASGGGERRVVSVNGCFDVLHVGHIRFLAEARGLGDELVVLINSDSSVRRYKGDTRPVFSLDFRMQALLELETVSRVLPFDGDKPLELIEQLKPVIHAKGGTYEADRVRQEKDLVSGWGGRIAYCALVEGRSTTRWIERAEAKG